MHAPVKASDILCFECVSTVSVMHVDEVEHVFCPHCRTSSTLEKALDDCFVFMVASAMSPSAWKNGSAYRYRFMPRSGDGRAAVQQRSDMLKTGRAAQAA